MGPIERSLVGALVALAGPVSVEPNLNGGYSTNSVSSLCLFGGVQVMTVVPKAVPVNPLFWVVTGLKLRYKTYSLKLLFPSIFDESTNK